VYLESIRSYLHQSYIPRLLGQINTNCVNEFEIRRNFLRAWPGKINTSKRILYEFGHERKRKMLLPLASFPPLRSFPSRQPLAPSPSFPSSSPRVLRTRRPSDFLARRKYALARIAADLFNREMAAIKRKRGDGRNIRQTQREIFFFLFHAS